MIGRMEHLGGHRGMLGDKALIEEAEFARTIAKQNKNKKRIQAVSFYFWIVPKIGALQSLSYCFYPICV